MVVFIVSQLNNFVFYSRPNANHTTATSSVYYSFVLIVSLLVNHASFWPPSFWPPSRWVVLLPALQYATSQFFGCYISTKHAKTVAKEAAELSQAPLPDPPTVQNMAEREFNKHRANQKAEFHASMAQAALCSGLCLALYAMLLGFYLAPPEVSERN